MKSIKKVKFLSLAFATTVLVSGLFPASAFALDDGYAKTTSLAASVSYRTHVQNVGWQDYVSDGKTSGTVGESLRLEAININIENDSNLGIQYSTHVQDIGWQASVSDGETAGTEGQSKRLEAIKINLTGTEASDYDVYYRVQVQDYGWLSWAENGEAAGTEGLAKRLEAIQIQIVSSSNTELNFDTTTPFISLYGTGNISYRTHVENIGWQNYVNDKTTSGTTGQSLRLEAINIRLGTNMPSGSVSYKTHVQDIGWMDAVSDGAMSGTEGKSKRLEAIQISLSGEIAELYDVYYRVHSQDYGWLGWAKNGESAGTEGFSKRLEGIEIVLVEKGEAAPGSTENAFIKNYPEYAEGIYKIGEKIPAGEYVIFANPGKPAFYCVSSDEKQMDVLEGNIFYNNSIVRVEDGEYLYMSDCYMKDIRGVNQLDTSGSGTFLAGKYIAAGEYVVFADNGNAYYDLYDENMDGIAYDYFENNSMVSIENGQYITIQGGYLKPVSEVQSLDTTKSGMFKVGTYLEAGEYVLIANENDIRFYANYSITTDANQTDNVSGEYFENDVIVKVEDGQYLDLHNCHAEKVSTTNHLDTTKSGMFLVGTHLTAGSYVLTPVDEYNGYYCISSDVSQEQETVVSEGPVNSQTTKTINVSDGQYLRIGNCTMSAASTQQPK